MRPSSSDPTMRSWRSRKSSQSRLNFCAARCRSLWSHAFDSSTPPTSQNSARILATQRLQYFLQTRGWILSEVDAKHAPPAFSERLVIAQGLRPNQLPEGVVRLRNRQVVFRLVHELQKHARVWSALVQLPGGMQEPRPESQRGGDLLLPSTQPQPDLLQKLFRFRRGLQIGLQRDVISGRDL